MLKCLLSYLYFSGIFVLKFVLFFQIQVQARDQTFPEKFATITVRVTIQRDRNTPRFSESHYSLAVDETTPVETVLTPSNGAIVATDRDDIQVRYTC